jgi:3-phenylpropionate/cinnamic acid dioxygenase small subunit
VTLSSQEVADRVEILDLLARYSAVVDRGAWEQMPALFTPDASLDFTATGGIRGTVADHQAFNAEVLTGFAGTQHVMGLPALSVDGDTATSRSICFNPMVVDDQHVFFVGLWYDDRLVRTPDGWRFAERVQQKSFFHNLQQPRP